MQEGATLVIIHEMKYITAKQILVSHSHPDPWFGCKYTMNIYRGCEHQCIYCDSRSECYQIENFSELLVKKNAIELLEADLPRRRIKGTICTGAMSDPYTPSERKLEMTRKALQVIAKYRFPVHLMTKSDMVVRDIDIFKEIAKTFATVTFTVTTADDELARKVEPGAPVSSLRFAAMKALSESGVFTGVTLMPVLPFIEDTKENIARIVELAHQNGATYIIPAFSMTLRDRQRAYYYEKLDKLFPGLSARYKKTYGDRYGCPVPNHKELSTLFTQLCKKYNISTKIAAYTPPQPAKQLPLVS